LNISTTFTEKERSRLGLYGLLPPQVESLDELYPSVPDKQNEIRSAGTKRRKMAEPDESKVERDQELSAGPKEESAATGSLSRRTETTRAADTAFSLALSWATHLG
jgi:hypothetical protein